MINSKQTDSSPTSFSIVLTLLVCIFVSYANASSYITNLTSEDGLYQASINAISTDNRGLIVFGTQDGLLTYDGIELSIIRKQNTAYSSLASNHINALKRDSSGTLWIGTRKGLHTFDGISQKLSRIDIKFDLSVSSLHFDINNTLWIGTVRNGLFKLNKNSASIQSMNQKLINNKTVSNIESTSENKLIMSVTDIGLVELDTESNELHVTNADSKFHLVTSLIVIDDHQIILGKGNETGIEIISTESETRDRLSELQSMLATEKIQTIFKDKRDDLWFGTETGIGLIKYSSRTDSFKKYYEETNGKGLTNNQVWSIFEDDNKNLWVGTNSGVSKFALNKALFGHFSASDNLNHIKNPIITAVFEDRENKLWVGTYGGGLYKFDDKHNEFQKISLSQETSSNYVIALNQDIFGNILVGTISGMATVSLSNQELKNREYFDLLKNERIRDIKIDHLQNMWINTDEELYFFNQSKNRMCNISESLGAFSYVFKYQEKIWLIPIGSVGQLFQINPDEFRCSTIVTEKKLIDIKSYFKPRLTDSDGNIWASVPNGLVKLGPDLSVKASFSEENGLTNGTIHEVLQDSTGAFWITSNQGLTKLKSDGYMLHYFATDGLQSNEFNGEASLKRNNGQFVLGGMNGLNIFDPTEIISNQTLATAHIHSVKLSGKEKNKVLSAIRRDDVDPIDVFPAFNGIEIDFVGLHFQDPTKNRYKYKLTGYEDAWNEVNFQKRFAKYTNLSPGQYTFELKVSNSDGLWSPINDTLRFNVIAPWYLTWWAYALYVICVFVGIYGLVQLRIRSLKSANLLLEQQIELRTANIAEQKQTIEKQVEELKALDKAKERFFENISHEFRTPLALTIGPLKRLYEQNTRKDLKEKLEVPLRQSSRLLRLINQFLEISRLNSGVLVLKKRNYRLSDQIRQIIYGFQDSLNQKDIKLNLTLDDDIVLSYDASAMEKILVNLISNAINYSHSHSEISVSAKLSNSRMYEEKHRVTIKVKDQGVGISQHALPNIFNRFNVEKNDAEYKQGMGVGLALVNDLVKMHDGEIHVTSELHVGSCFIVHIPVSVQEDDIASLEKEGELSPISLEKLIAKDVKHDQEVDSVDASGIREADNEHLNTILIVDDEPDMRSYLSELLQDYHLLVASNGAEALAIAIDIIPDLIISDVMMPLMNGLELVKSIKEHVNTSHIPIILVTAKGGRDSKLEGLREGIDDYIVKPFDDEELLLRVSNILDIRRELTESNRAHTVSRKSDAKSHLPLIERQFVDKLHQFLQLNYSQTELSVEDIASAMHLEKRQLQRKLKGLLNSTPSDYLRTFRLQRAAELLQTGETVNHAFEISGFNNLSHFSRCFKAAYSVSPSQYFVFTKNKMSQES